MVYYVRFLKTPRIQKGSITALICITTDLGDAFLAEDADLVLTVEKDKEVVYKSQIKWNAYNRELPITLGPLPVNLIKTLVLKVDAEAEPPSKSKSISESDLSPSIPLIVGAISAPFGPQNTPAAKLVQRTINAPEAVRLQVWEETGNSIARHIWDAGLATVVYLGETLQRMSQGDVKRNKATKSPLPALEKVLRTSRSSVIQVVELGAGCGIVGIGLAQMLSHCSVLLTDLPEVEEIITRNINETRPANVSSVRYQNLDWEQPPDDLCSQPIALILVSDCTYNADSLPVLVSCLDRLVRTSPEAIVLVSLKRRHESETVFFDLMRSAGFRSVQDSMELPSEHGQVDEIEFYCYSRDVRV
ncbi:unnamed protein product [Penicillium salamii]|uniref:Uncharacterized protein n=1 Tax=Penicillium salamii TaxID=1612424 RepID=A0A9W4NLE7_9EURO|nr:unnamed protein product [Penicillium salamii]CAG8191016.1 unnamed protein product [Penicillium salamii]CAG8285520.1 unnamed protein product [Penicillium salamii]CAG8297403.1 unnamed protein product [Penicillium salamii]CAG8374673.1 unnamed protein product [Penicillium salamii]